MVPSEKRMTHTKVPQGRLARYARSVCAHFSNTKIISVMTLLMRLVVMTRSL